ncbi:MAG: hypothetical protein AAF204_00920 [Pseudomonadota bacterium]
MQKPQLLKDFKAAYDAMDHIALSNLFADEVNFKGTADTEYRHVLRQDIAEYFGNFVAKRNRQSVDLLFDTLEREDNVLRINAVFRFVNKGQTEEQEKPISFEMSVNDQDGAAQICEFGSSPR